MRSLWALLMAIGLMSTLSGCSYGPMSNCYYQKVDDINDHQIYFDEVYYWYCRDCECRKFVPFGNCY